MLIDHEKRYVVATYLASSRLTTHSPKGSETPRKNPTNYNAREFEISTKAEKSKKKKARERERYRYENERPSSGGSGECYSF